MPKQSKTVPICIAAVEERTLCCSILDTVSQDRLQARYGDFVLFSVSNKFLLICDTRKLTNDCLPPSLA